MLVQQFRGFLWGQFKKRCFSKKIKCLVIVYMAQTISVGSITETITNGSTTAMTIGASQTTAPITIGGALSSGAITLGGLQSTGDINIGTNSTSDIYIGNIASGMALNSGICHINKLQIASGSVFRSVLFGTVAGGSGSNTVSFGQTLPVIPLVVATITSTSLTQVFSVTISATTTGFTYYKNFCYTDAVTAGGAAVDEAISWIAICT